MTAFGFRVLPSPVGDVLVVAAETGIVSVHPFDGPLGAEWERLARQLGGVPAPDDEVAGDLDRQLEEYFDGTRRAFALTLDWRLVQGVRREALAAVCEIPYGRTASYGEVAIMAGRPRAARAVGTACATTPFSLVVPVHRVVRADGRIGEYGGRPEVKRFLLDLEHRVGE